MRRRILDQVGEEGCIEETHPLMQHHNSIISCSSCLRFRQYIGNIYIYEYNLYTLSNISGGGGGGGGNATHKQSD